MMNAQPDYSDSLVEVSQTGIRFRNYYFPFGSKFVRFFHILRVTKMRPTLWNGKWRLWGTGDFRTWFPRDWRRPQRSCIFLLRLSTQKTRIGFTVEDPERFVEVVKSRGLKNMDSCLTPSVDGEKAAPEQTVKKTKWMKP